jgi:hypothetical protein
MIGESMDTPTIAGTAEEHGRTLKVGVPGALIVKKI